MKDKHNELKRGARGTAEPQPVVSSGDAVDPNLDRVRELLFGNQLRGLERKFADTQSRVNTDLTAEVAQVRNALHSLETFAQNERDSIGRRMSSEKDQREQKQTALEAKLDALSKTVDKLSSDIFARLDSLESALRTLVRSEVTRVEQHSQGLYDELSHRLSSEHESLRQDKVSNSSLAGRLRDFAQALDGQDAPDMLGLLYQAEKPPPSHEK